MNKVRFKLFIAVIATSFVAMSLSLLAYGTIVAYVLNV